MAVAVSESVIREATAIVFNDSIARTSNRKRLLLLNLTLDSQQQTRRGDPS